MLPGMGQIEISAIARRWLRLGGRRYGMAALLVCAGLWVAGIWAQGVPAQDGAATASEAEPAGPPTLHLTTNLVQIPVLILTTRGERLTSPIAPERFQVKLHGGPAFQPKYARLEGNDPLDLAIVVDTRITPDEMLRKLDEDVAGLVPEFLHASDHVSIYVVDCSNVELVQEVPADGARLKRAVGLALSGWKKRREQKTSQPCDTDTHLWDILAYVTTTLAKQPGWHAIVTLTDGRNKKGKFSADDLTRLAQDDQVTILGLDPFLTGSHGFFVSKASVDDFTEVCGGSGGLWLGLFGKTVAEQLQWFTEILRDRYIVEFPRPPNLTAGKTAMTIKIKRMDAFIRAAGDLVPLTE